jgi:hypothetical protein
MLVLRNTRPPGRPPILPGVDTGLRVASLPSAPITPAPITPAPITPAPIAPAHHPDRRSVPSAAAALSRRSTAGGDDGSAGHANWRPGRPVA